MKRLFAAAALLLALAPAFGHGASKGLHLHVVPDSASPGAEVKVRVDAAAPMVRMTISFVGTDPVEFIPNQASRSLTARLKVPADTKLGAINVQAEAHAVDGKAVRASAVVKVLK